MTSQTFNLELIPQGVPPIVHVSQYDKGQTWLIDVTENGIPFTIPSGTSVAIQGTKPDNTGFQYAGTYSGTQVEFTVEQQMTVLAGELDCELVLVNGEEQVATINFILAVEPAALDDETIISETELPLIEQAAELGAVINAYATQIHADAETATAAATSASADATTATAAADDATASKTAAAASASNAATSETNAAASETAAAGSASAAAQSATDAAASAALAAQQAATDMTGATANDDGAHGLVPQPLAGDEAKFLRGDGTWEDVPTQLSGLTDVDLNNLADGQLLKYDATAQKWKNAELSYVGMIIHSTTLATEADVKAFYGGSTWLKLEGTFLLGQGTAYPTVNTLGGEAAHTLTIDEMPQHNHTVNNGAALMAYSGTNELQQTTGGGRSYEYLGIGYTGGSQAHNNMPPYRVVYIWLRTS